MIDHNTSSSEQGTPGLSPDMATRSGADTRTESVQDTGGNTTDRSYHDVVPIRRRASGDGTKSVKLPVYNSEPSTDQGTGSESNSSRDSGVDSMGEPVPEQHMAGEQFLHKDSADGGTRGNRAPRRQRPNSGKFQSNDASKRVTGKPWEAVLVKHYEWGVWSELPVIRCNIDVRNPNGEWDYPCGYAIVVPDDYRRARQLRQARDHFWFVHKLKLLEE